MSHNTRTIERKPSASADMKSLVEKKVLQCILEHDLLMPQQSILVACSGGPDSMALLHLLANLRETQGYRLGAICIDHNLRSSSAAELELVREQANALEIPFYGFSEDVQGYAAQKGISLEMAGREIRYARFAEVAQEHHYDAIAVAHHQGDQAETILAHLMRGAGAAGLRGMAYKKGNIIRPLLEVTKDELVDFLVQKKISYAIDETNNELLYERNKIRLQLLPLMETFNPCVQEALCKMGKLQGEEDDFMESLAREWLPKILHMSNDSDVATQPVVDAAVFRSVPIALRRRLWRMLVQPFYERGHMPSLSTVERLDKLLEGGQGEKQFFVKKMKVYYKYDKIYFVSPEVENIPQDIPSEYVPNWKIVCHTPQHSPVAGTFILPEIYGKSLQVRTRREGDIFLLTDKTGHVKGHKKLKKHIMEKQIPRNERDTLLWLASGQLVFCEARPNSSYFLYEEGCTSYIEGEFKEAQL